MTWQKESKGKLTTSTMIRWREFEGVEGAADVEEALRYKNRTKVFVNLLGGGLF